MALPGSAYVSIGVGLYEGITGSGKRRKQAKEQMKKTQEQMDALGKQRHELENIYNLEGRLLTDQYGNQVGNLRDKIGTRLFDLAQSENSAIAKSGLAYSGSIDSKSQLASQQQRKDFEIGSESLYDRLQKDQLGLTKSRAEDTANLDMRMAELEGQYAEYKQQSKSKFLGLF